MLPVVPRPLSSDGSRRRPSGRNAAIHVDLVGAAAGRRRGDDLDRSLGSGVLGAEIVIRLDDVTLAYGRTTAVRHVTGEFATGSLTAVIGSNGAGKSTLLKALAGILKPIRGRLDRGGLTTTNVAYLPQQAAIDRDFPISVCDTVLLGAWASTGAFDGVSRGTFARAGEALATVGLAGFERRAIGLLSTGQLQRVLFARLVLQDAALILLDEPFAAIDPATTVDLMSLVRRWHREGRTVIAVLHDLDQVRAEFPDSLALAVEPIAWGPTDCVLSAFARRAAPLSAVAPDRRDPPRRRGAA